MNTLYNFLTSMCKEKDMKIEDLQKKLNVSRTTLYRYMKGINRITLDLAQKFVIALDLDAQQSLEFSKFVSLSAFDQSLIESRHVLDDFLFGKQQKPKSQDNVDMILYNKDKYLRTIKEVFDFIGSFESKEAYEGEVKIVNCLDENIFAKLTDQLIKAFSSGLKLNVEHYIGISLKDYLQNTYSFTRVFPLIKYDNYKMFYRERETESNLLNDSILVSLSYIEDGKQVNQYFSVMFYESGMPECVAFDDVFIFKYLAKIYENLKSHHKDVVQKCSRVDFAGDVFMEIEKYGGSYVIKPTPGYDRIPFEVYDSLVQRMNDDEKKMFVSALLGEQPDDVALPDAVKKVLQNLKKQIEFAQKSKQLDVYSRDGLSAFWETGRLTDHPEHLPAFDQNERRMILESLYARSNSPRGNYSFYITENDMSRKDFILDAGRGCGVLVGYVSPECQGGARKMLYIQSERLALIFCDYLENHIPVNNAIEKDRASLFLRDLLNSR